MSGKPFLSAIILLLISSLAHAQQNIAQQSNADCLPVKVEGGTVQFLVIKKKNGYALLLPPDLLRKFPQSANYKIGLVNKKNKKAVIVGRGIKNGENFLEIATRQIFKLESIDRNDLEAIHISGADSRPSTQSDRCRGCNLDPMNLEPYDTKHTICFCEIKKEP